MYRTALTATILWLGQLALGGTAGAQSRTIAADIAQQPSAGYVIQGSFAPADGTRAYWLTLAAGQSVEVTALPLGGADPVLTVYDEAGAELATNDDFGDGLAARVPLFSAAGQRVRVVVSQLGESVEGLGDAPHFTLTVTPSDWQPAEPQTVASLPYSHEGTLRANGEQAFIFTAKQGDTFEAAMGSDGSGLDPYLRIVPATPGQVPTVAGTTALVEDDDSGGDLAAQLVFTPPGAGTYAAIASGVGSASGSYTFGLSRIELPDPIEIGLDETVQGVVASIAAPPVYRLSPRAIAALVRQPGVVQIAMNALGEGEDALDPSLTVALDTPFGPSEIATDDDGGGELNALVTLPVSQHQDLARWLRDLRITATTVMGLDAPGGFELTITR
jgi:hypothetical protein